MQSTRKRLEMIQHSIYVIQSQDLMVLLVQINHSKQ